MMQLYWHRRGVMAHVGPRYEFWEYVGNPRGDPVIRYAQYEFSGSKEDLEVILGGHYAEHAEDYNTFIFR